MVIFVLNYIWGALIIISIVCALATGRIDDLSKSVFSGAEDAVGLLISMLGMMCLWTGLMNIAEKSGLTSALAKLFSPILKTVFPMYNSKSREMKAICMNITANLLGLGNAATPMGIIAMKEMQKNNPHPKSATNAMVMFVVINTASLQIMPTMMTILRQKHGSLTPLDILPAIWITSVCALIAGVIASKILERRGNYLE